MMIFKKLILLGVSLIFTSSCQTQNSIGQEESRIISEVPKPSRKVRVIKESGPKLLSFQQLKELAADPEPKGALAAQYDKLLSTPFIDNSAYYRSGMPQPTSHPALGSSIRVTTWNIEKSIKIAEVAEIMSSQNQFEHLMKDKVRKKQSRYDEATRQRIALASSDVLLLQEMDLGHRRSQYLFAAQHLARKMNMNFVYAPQQLEIDPLYLGLDKVKFLNGEIDEEASRSVEGDAGKYRGVFGVAVLSRYPIKDVKLFQLKNQPYDWYHEEFKRPDALELGRRQASETLFKFEPVREVKVGGRAFTQVDLHVPGIPLETLSVINVHLEIKTTPMERQKQLEEILSHIKGIKNPVVMAGDFNSSALDVSATSFRRFLKNTATSPSRLLSAGLFVAKTTGISQFRSAFNGIKNLANPIAWNIPVVFPNKTRTLFTTIKKFRFDDGGAFDFRGDPARSSRGKGGLLSNSNQRQLYKGFTYTFSVPRSISVIGCARLDWIFVKSFLTHPRDKKGSYRLAPHFGETLDQVNLAMKETFSDHHPITTVLPLREVVETR